MRTLCGSCGKTVLCSVPSGGRSTERHFTATGYVTHRRRVLLHWHPKVKAMLPPGGHVEAGEDPVTAVLREIQEETGISAEVIPRELPVDVAYPRQISPPETIMVEDIDDPVVGPHEHVDLIYFCRLGDGQGDGTEGLRSGWTWVSEEALSAGASISMDNGMVVTPPEDVRQLALAALHRAL